MIPGQYDHFKLRSQQLWYRSESRVCFGAMTTGDDFICICQHEDSGGVKRGRNHDIMLSVDQLREIINLCKDRPEFKGLLNNAS